MNDLITAKLSKAFPFASHKWRVLTKSKKGDKATWYVYVDARDVAQRLDETGLDWSDEYEVIAMAEKLCVVQCKLTIGGSTRTDVGSDSKSSIDSEGNYIKGAYSDALKRAAVKFGVGRYLYQMTNRYLPIDEYGNFTPDSVTRIKAHLSQELKAFGASGSEKDLRDDTEYVEATEVVEPIPVQKTAPEDAPATTVSDDIEMISNLQKTRVNILGKELYDPKEWEIKRPAIIKGLTKGKETSLTKLTEVQADALIQMLDKRVKAKELEESNPFVDAPPTNAELAAQPDIPF